MRFCMLPGSDWDEKGFLLSIGCFEDWQSLIKCGHSATPDLAMTPEQWVVEEKLMPGALQGYTYAEDGAP